MGVGDCGTSTVTGCNSILPLLIAEFRHGTPSNQSLARASHSFLRFDSCRFALLAGKFWSAVVPANHASSANQNWIRVPLRGDPLCER